MAYVSSVGSFGSANPSVPSGSTGDTLVAIGWEVTAAPDVSWTSRGSDANGWQIWTKTRTASEGATYAFTPGGFPVLIIYDLSGTSETSFGTPVYSSGNDTSADNGGVTAGAAGTAIFGVLSFDVITNNSQTNSFIQIAIDGVGGNGAGYYKEVGSGAVGSTSATVLASDYRTIMIVMEDTSVTGPTITGQPSAAHVNIGDTASFTVSATAFGGGTLSYQWKLGGVNVSTGSGGTTATYTTATLTLAEDLGSYTCVVTETGGTADGTKTTTAAILRVGVYQVGTTTAVYGTTSLTPAYVASPQSGDLWVVIVGQKPSAANSGTLTTPGTYTLQTSRTGANDGDTGGYTTTLGADTGNTNIFALTDTATGSETGTLALTLGTSNSAWAKLYLYRKPPGTTWAIAGVSGKDTTAANVSITFASDPGVTVGDAIVAAMCVPTDVTSPRFSAEAFSQTGVTFGTVTEDEEPNSGTGNDIGGLVTSCRVTAGPSSAAPVFTATVGGTNTNIRGPGVFLRMRANAAAAPGGTRRRMLLGVGA